VHQDLLKHWKTNKETEPIKKAIRFLFLSNFTYLGKQDILRSSPDNSKAILINRLKETNKLIFDVQFFNIDCLEFLKTLSLDSRKRLLTNETFIYADPPYIGTEMSTYENGNKWKKENTTELVNTLNETKCKWCMSEFDHPHILQLVQEHNLNLIYIGERRNLKNKRTEVIVTNYKLENTLF
jgi:DNA adenine methylase